MTEGDDEAVETGDGKALGQKAQTNRRRTGARYERQAAEYLEKKGYRILERNFYTRYGEIDIIARDGRYLVFLEVKYRRDAGEGHPLEAVDLRKQNKIRKTARFFLQRHGYRGDEPCRFDVIGILGGELVHVEDAF